MPIDWYYSHENLTGASNMTEIWGFLNEVTNSWFFILILIAFWIVMFTALLRWGERKALVTSSFVTAMLTIIMAAAGLVDAVIVPIPLMMTIFALIILRRE
jgi:hypothetical protein